MPFKIVRNDITKMEVDAIVNTANPNPTYASGTDAAIYTAAGAERLLVEREKIGKIEVGDAAITSAFDLVAKYIIHTVGPIWNGGNNNERGLLQSCYWKSLDLAKENECKSVAFPLISTGVYGFPKDEALQIALSTISDFLMKEDIMVYLVVFDDESYRLSEKLFTDVDSFIDENYVQEKVDTFYTDEFRQRSSIFDTASLPDLSNESMSMPFIPMAARETDSVEICAKSSTSGRKLEDVIEEVGESFQERLLRLIDERQLTNAEVYKRANLNRKLFSKILCNPNYHPKKRTVVAFAIALELNLDETKDLLSRAEFAFSPSSRFDLIIQYFIEREIYDVYQINVSLFDHNEPLLGE